MADWNVVSETPAPAAAGGWTPVSEAPAEQWKPVAVKTEKESTFQPISDWMDYVKTNFSASKNLAENPPAIQSAPASYGAAKAGLPDIPKKPTTAPARALGVAGMIAAPAGGVPHALVSKPLERTTGIPAEDTDLALMFTPAGAGAVLGVAGRATKMIPGAETAVRLATQNPVAKMASKAIQAAVSPTTMSKEAGQAEGIVREQRGLAERSTEQAKAKLEPDYEYLSNLPSGLPPKGIASAAKKEGAKIVPGAKHAAIPGSGEKGFVTNEGKFLTRKQADKTAKATGALTQPEITPGKLHSEDIGQPSPKVTQLSFINRVENFSKNTPLPDARAEKAAQSIRGIYQTVRNDLQTDQNFDKMGFVQDYFPHLWKDPNRAQEFIQGWAKTGSSRATQKRSIPTIEDGLKAGLELKTANPAEATLQYIGNMYNYKALKGIQSSMADEGLRKFAPRGRQQPGWVELKGPGNRVLYVDKKGQPHESVAYAPEDAARIYNRYYSPGFTGPIGAGVRGLRKIVNNGTQLALGLSAYHYRLLANESTAAALSKGSAKGALEATPYLGAARHYLKGKAVENQYITGKGDLDQKIIDYATRAGGRMKGIDKAMDMGASGDYWRAWQNGSLKAAMKADTLNLKAGGPIKTIMKTMGSVSQPLFMKTIPRIKNAVNYEAIGDWIKAHPTASDDEILKASRDIVDSTDNRFGELIQDNIFWDKKLKEATQLMLLSVGWSLGTGRETIGGVKDLANFIAGKGEMTQRARYVLAAPIAHMLNASVYQALRGQGPPQDLQDLVYPRTGGTSPYNSMPERSNLPSQEKDIIGYQKRPMQELQNKMAPLWRTVAEMATNKDWRGDPLAYSNPNLGPGWMKAYAQEVLGAFAPISIKGALQPSLKGSNIGPAGRFMGDRPASMEAENPEGYKRMVAAQKLKAEKIGARHQATQKQREQP